MNPYEMVAIIVVVGAIAGVARSYFSTRHQAAPDAGQQARIDALEQRVMALEAVVSDHGYSLRQEFRKLEES